MTVTVANRAAPMQTPAALGAARALALSAFAGVFLANSGAFDTEAARLLPRLAYWLFIALLSTAALEGCHRLLHRFLGNLSEPRLRLYGLLLLVLPLTLIAALTCKLLFGGRPSIGGYLTLLPGMASILVVLQIVIAFFSRRKTAEGEAALPEVNELVASLPLPLRSAPIDALQAEDHYVRVYTGAGQALVRMRFRDAVAAVASSPGFCPHRSWWVAERSVAALRRAQGRATLTLAGGQQVPVNREVARRLGPDFGGMRG